jgi:hypothetical protein
MEVTVDTLRRRVWLLPAALALHELEEWNILGWYNAHWVNVDPITMTSTSVHVWLVFASVAAFVGTFAVTATGNFPLLLRLQLLPAFVIVFGHAFAHLYWTWRFSAYAPGVVTSVILIIPVTLYVLDLARRVGVVSSRYQVILLAASSLPLLAAIEAGNRVPQGGVPWLRFSTWLINLWRA